MRSVGGAPSSVWVERLQWAVEYVLPVAGTDDECSAKERYPEETDW